MKKLIVAIALLMSASFALDQDYFRVNVGSRTGQMSRTATPVVGKLTLTGIAQPSTANMETNTTFLYMKSVSPNVELGYISKDASGNITVGTIASN